MKTIKCINCGRELPVENFKRRGRGFVHVCSECQSAKANKVKSDPGAKQETVKEKPKEITAVAIKLQDDNVVKSYEAKIASLQKQNDVYGVEVKRLSLLADSRYGQIRKLETEIAKMKLDFDATIKNYIKSMTPVQLADELFSRGFKGNLEYEVREIRTLTLGKH